jgi:hypothetical protein
MAKRQIEPKLVAFIEEKLKGNGLYEHALETKDFRFIMVEAAKCLVGIKEKTGHNDGEFIKLIQETVGGASGEPYCAAGMMTIIAFAELKTGLESPIPATELAREIWTGTPKQFRVKKIPAAGAIAVWGDLDSKGKLKLTGHAEVVLSADDKEFHDVGFNTSGTTNPNSEVNRDGNGVYYTKRNYKATKARKLLGFVKPI